ncbi:MAG: phosphoglycerate dehydrogenase [Candidatus Tectomicrobia bacterium]|uniref:Phosphoglycerate dehydrogenase n=1 Tax=Tectimicrobiota bacterium TaxID=2528274 RepID=A0A932HYE5_UNCTE|nr:phosphoglycerate dehydrogenase [Candidatus Tectomicrobia bacterium]
MPRIAVPDDFPSVLAGSRAEARLRELGEVEIFTTKAGSPGELLRRVRGAEAVVNIRAFSRFDAGFFSRARGLRHLSIWGTGTDNVDLAAARAAGVTVTNTPGVAAASVAEHAIALMLAVARRIPLHDAAVRRGEWPRGGMTQLRGKTLGLVGLGAIGRETARLARGLGMKLLAWTFHPDPAFAAEAGLEWAERDALYARSDVISLHVRLSPETRGMIGEAAFARMKPGAILVNTARGPVVEEKALLAALASGRLAGAGLDVFEAEPLPAGHPLAEFPQVVLSPHNAGITPEAAEAGLLLAAENVAAFFAGRPRNVVN